MIRNKRAAVHGVREPVPWEREHCRGVGQPEEQPTLPLVPGHILISEVNSSKSGLPSADVQRGMSSLYQSNTSAVLASIPHDSSLALPGHLLGSKAVLSAPN